jgi:hypothetical protein
MTSTVDRITSSTSKFVETTRSICRIYREFDIYSQEEMLIWLKVAVRLQNKMRCSKLQHAINELSSAIESKATARRSYLG